MVTSPPVFARQRCWGGNSVGRALRSQRRGREFESHPLHQFFRRRRFHSSLQPAGRKSGEHRYSVCSGSEQRIKRAEAPLWYVLVGGAVRRGGAPNMNGSGLKQPDPKRGYPMPKKKTHKSSSKRCKITATGKVVSSRAGKRHLASSKSRKRKRNLRGMATMSKPEQKRVKKLLAS